MANDEFYICERCKERIDPTSTDTIRARKRIRVRDFDGSELMDGEGVFFHARHWPGEGKGYRRVSDDED